MRVSAALIVRNESAYIEDCLKSLTGLVDEIVVVDTGSTDDTVEKAHQFPVKLHSFEWRQDFSAARNYALDRATGDWILYIDADERLEVPDRDAWRDVLADKNKAGWRLRFHQRVGWTPYMELRLFRNDPRIRFRGVIHECMRHGVDAVCREDGLEIGSCNVALHHFGYEGGQGHKVSRNVPLLREYLSKDPNRVYCWWHLGQMLMAAGDEAGAAEAWENGIAAARRHGATRDMTHALPFFSLTLLEAAQNKPVNDLLEEGIARFPDQLALRWLAAKHAVEEGKGEAARKDLEELAAIDPDTFVDPRVCYNKTLFTHKVPETLALCHFRAGRFREAAEWYRRAASGAPDPRACEVRAQLAEAKARKSATLEGVASFPKPSPPHESTAPPQEGRVPNG
jgi:tetratricopeptide (TPR) repeat protein